VGTPTADATVDMMSAYSAASLGHSHPRILAALEAQAETPSRSHRAPYYNDRLGSFPGRTSAGLTGLDAVLSDEHGRGKRSRRPSKAARRMGAIGVKGVPKDRAEIIVADGKFSRAAPRP